MAFCTYGDISLITNISTSDISNTDITSLISEATKLLNSLINVEVIREEVIYLDETRENEIDSSNTTYYIRNWKEGYLADSDSDGDVDTSDLKVYAVHSDGTETEATISSISTSNKSFTLDTAYSSNYRLFVTYSYCFKNPATPDPLIALACKYFTASMAYMKLNVGRSPEQSFGNKKIMRHMQSPTFYYDMAMKIVEEINYKGANLREVSTNI